MKAKCNELVCAKAWGGTELGSGQLRGVIRNVRAPSLMPYDFPRIFACLGHEQRPVMAAGLGSGWRRWLWELSNSTKSGR